MPLPPPDKIIGHTLVIGSTGSGKSYFIRSLTKYLGYDINNTLIFCDEISSEQWLETGKIYNRWDEDSSSEIRSFAIKNKKQNSSSLIIFDDFWNKINMSKNKNFIELFQNIRHSNARIIIAIHTVNDLPATVKENIAQIFLAYIQSNHLRSELATTFFGGNIAELHRLMDEVSEMPYNILHRNKITRETSICNASMLSPETPKEVSKEVLPWKDPSALRGASEETPLGLRGASSDDCKITAYDATKKTIINGGSYSDNSQNISNHNVQIDTNIQKTMTMNKMSLEYSLDKSQQNNLIEENNYYHARKMEKIKQKDRIRELIYKDQLTPPERHEVAQGIAKFIKDSSVTHTNFRTHKYDQEFMCKYFPKDNYVSPGDNFIDMIATHTITEDKFLSPNLVEATFSYLKNRNKPQRTNTQEVKELFIEKIHRQNFIGNHVSEHDINILKLFYPQDDVPINNHMHYNYYAWCVFIKYCESDFLIDIKLIRIINCKMYKLKDKIKFARSVYPIASCEDDLLSWYYSDWLWKNRDKIHLCKERLANIKSEFPNATNWQLKRIFVFYKNMEKINF